MDDHVAALRTVRLPLVGDAADHDALLDAVGEARFVLLGEASHGTHEFYAERARITRRLIDEHGFDAVAVEADWPDAYRVNCYVRGRGDDRSADGALGDFVRFPRWMWRNRTVVDLVESIRQREGVGFYGLDLYSLHASIGAVLRYLDEVDPQAAQRARERYGCFEYFGEDVQAYGYAVSRRTAEPCEDDVVGQLLELQRRRPDDVDDGDRDAAFFAEQNARLVANAEAYYRAMFWGSVRSWNLRDTHMADTLDALADHLGPDSRIVVWAHNSHVGDARATELGAQGELNLGQLVRERHGDDAFIVGFTTHTGTVTAATDWDGPAERKRVNPSLGGSTEALLHDVGGDFSLDVHDEAVEQVLGVPRLGRAIGVIYRPRTERQSHYFECVVADQFDWLIHVDVSRAVEPLDAGSGWTPDEVVPETYPSAL